MLENTGTVIRVSSGGGPLILLSRELVPSWEGCDPPSAGRVVEADFRWNKESDPATDYDRACDVEGYLGLIGVGWGYGLVLGDEPEKTGWWSDNSKGKTEGMLVHWEWAESEQVVSESLARIPDDIWQLEDFTFSVGMEPLCLFDAGYRGKHMEDYLLIDLQAGTYSVATAEYEPDQKTSLVLHKLSLLTA